ncbi:unnamed protein product [Spirodela intermedia]|uniref:Protein kinase domain-containing protein n=1 Tax=Spirodela intermedia TaxID=51605 RepID=A0A7I8JED7_SPIIN|nr:unnamed protein product [Spirodela intermedia]CAA6667762.1 unnamed protein product [Spirodela intermedia]
MGFNWIILPILLFNFTVTLALTNSGDAAALRSLENIWANVPLNWQGSDPCSSQWTGVGCRDNRVVSIRLSSIGLEGTLSGDIESLTELEILQVPIFLDLSYNKGLTGNLPAAIGNLRQLTDLILVGCSFSGEIPDLGSLQNLVFLSLNSNQFTGGIPSSLGKLSKLYWLDLADNQLSGPIPVSSGTSPGLDMLIGTKHFHFGKNQLSGTVPSKLFSSDMRLIHLRLDRNSFTGPLPSNLNNLTNVGELYVSNNKFTGPLPNLTGMSALRYVDLSNNTFDPSDAPPWFSTLRSLTTLVMESLRVGGEIPQSLFTIPQLQTLRLRNNLFNGTLDIGSNFSGQLQLVDLENNRIERFVEGGGYKNELRLLGNPYCDQSTSDTRCATGIRSTLPYTTPIPNCQQLTCSADQKQSPNCRCAYPYTGNLYFRAVSFSDLWNATKFQALEAGLLKSFQSQQIPVGSVALSNTFTNEDSYLQTTLQVFPAENPRFNQSEISIIGFILSNQTFKPPSFFGPSSSSGHQTALLKVNPGSGSGSGSGSSSDSSSKSNVPVIIGAVAGGCVIALIASFLVVYVMRRKKEPSKPKEQSQPFATWDPTRNSGSVPHITGPKPFTFDELRQSTNDFSNANAIGSGGYGKVYKGILPTGKLVAIKRAQQGSMQGGLEFKTEIELLSMVHHKNLVKLVGFCFDREEQMLVYEYVPNGSLKESLSGKSGVVLDWRRRLRVAVGAARGLSYLHDHSNNILLDENLNAKVADFGLSKPLGGGQKGYITTQVKGTIYYMTQQLTEKSDVYSFGVLMLELITAKKPIEKGRYIVREVRVSMDKTKDLYGLDELLDPKLGLATRLKGFERYVQLAMQCVEEAGVDRPRMSEVVKEIETIMLLVGMNPASDSTPTSESYGGPAGAHPAIPTAAKASSTTAVESSPPT